MEDSATFACISAFALACRFLRSLRRKQLNASPFELFNPCERRKFFTVKHDFCRDGVLPLWVADMELCTAPSIQAAIANRARHPTFGYTIQPSELWSRVARWWRERHHWHGLQHEDFIFTSNLVASTVNGIRAFTKPNDAVAVLLPLYHPLQEAVEKSGRILVTVHLKSVRKAPSSSDCTMPQLRYEIDFDALRLAIKEQKVKLLIWCSPHNPGGRVWTRAELKRVIAIAREFNVFIISDEVHSDLVLPPTCTQDHSGADYIGRVWRPHTPLALVARDDCDCYPRVMTMAGPGKTWNLSGLHCSYVIITNPEVRSSYMRVVAHAFLHFGGTFATTALMAAYANEAEAECTQGVTVSRLPGAPGPWLDTVLIHIRDNVDYVQDFVRRRLPLMRVMRPDATFLVWLDCTGLGLNATTTTTTNSPSLSPLVRFFLEEAKVMLSPGEEFGGVVTAQFMRLNVACPRWYLTEALHRIWRAYERRFGTHSDK